MTRRELIRRLDELGVWRGSYSLDGSTEGEQYCVARDGDRWAVYYSERGHRSGERLHATQAEAFDDLFERVRRDPLARWRPGDPTHPPQADRAGD